LEEFEYEQAIQRMQQSNHEKKGGYGKHNPTNQNYEKEAWLFPNHSHKEAVVAYPVTAII
jgi:hypothetical protein